MTENKILFEGADSKSTRINYADNNVFKELLNPLGLLQPKINLINALYHYDVIFKIESFRLLINIESLAVAPFPDIYPEDSAGTKNNKLLQTEHHNPHIIFRIFKNQGDVDYELGDVYLQNKGMQYNKSLLRPYLMDGNTNVKLWGLNNILKARLVNKTYGLLSIDDFLQIEIDYSYIITGIEKAGINVQPYNFAKNIATTPQQLIGINSRRVRLSFKNEGESSVSFAFGSQSNCVVGQCPELQPGQAFNDENKFPFQQAVWVVSHENSNLISGLEGSIYG